MSPELVPAGLVTNHPSPPGDRGGTQDMTFSATAGRSQANRDEFAAGDPPSA